MGEAVVQKLDDLHSLDRELHWFCPRASADDGGFYFDDDVLLDAHEESEAAKAARSKKVRRAEERRDAALEACKIFAFDGSDARPFQDTFRTDLGHQLGRCEICVREFHRARSLLVQRLEAEFEADEVREFMHKFDEMNFSRINARLDDTCEVLRDLPPEQRNISAIGTAGMYALFEAMNCVPYLRNEQALQAHFDEPFRLVQTKKKLRLPTYAPGMICFLYSRNQERATWAVRNLGQIKRQLTGPEFDFSVKPFFEAAMARVHILSLEREFLPAFWRGTKLVISKLTRELITTKVRALDSNIYTEALEHFQIDGSHFVDLLSSYESLMSLSPACFWEALGAINGQAVEETIFRSPSLQRLLTTREEREPLLLEERMQWTVTLIESIAPANVVPPLRSMLDQLLRHYQKEAYSRYAQSVTWTKGLLCLSAALKMVAHKVKTGPLVANMIEVVSKDHIDAILLELTGTDRKTSELQISKNEQLCLDIVEQTLAMDVAALIHARHTVLKKESLDTELQISSLEMWKRSMRIVRPGFAALPVAILSGISGLLPLESFTSRQVDKALKPAKGWNDALRRALSMVSDEFLGHLDAFEADDVLEIMQDPRGLDGLMRLLFNADTQVHHESVTILKVLSEAEDRRDCLMHVLSVFYPTALPSVSQIMEEITKARGLTPARAALKVCTDVFSCLTDSSDGLLRSSRGAKRAEQLADYWSQTWKLLGMIFQQTEPWSNLGYEKDMLQDFCRETMDFAGQAFDQYAIIASAIQEETGEEDRSVRRKLLEQPRARFDAISKWLRLRDEYLIEKAVSLTVKMLGRLREMAIKIESAAAQYVEDIIMTTDKNNRVKTKLTMQQKAELQRALEKHLGESLTEVIDLEATGKPMKQKSLQEWASSGRSGSSTPIGGASKAARPGTIDVDAWSDAAKRRKAANDESDAQIKKYVGSMDASERFKAMRQQQPQPARKAGLSSVTVKDAEKGRQEFLMKRKQEKEETERRRQAAIAKAAGVGVGSGVAGLGDMGKDHTLKGKNVMVSSDEESEDDDDELDADLFGEMKTRKKIERPNVHPNGAIGLKPEQKAGPTRIQRTARSARDMRARLAPDLTSLHKVILSWDFFHIGDYPPNSQDHQFRLVADSFNDPVTYQQTFQPLLTLEAWQGLVKSREESIAKPFEVKIQNRTNVDSFIELSSIVGHAENRDLQLQESDIILLSKAAKPTEDNSAPHCLARIYRVKRLKAHLEIVYQVLPGTSLAPSLSGQTTVNGVKVHSITPLEREYGALQALQYYDLCTQIIKARPSKKMNFSSKQLDNYQDIWNVNRAQSEAINAALENEGFSLIQGPPGSGKTKTIVAIVGGLLTNAFSTSSGTRITAPKAHASTNGAGDMPARKLLVCAPSNAAVDELVMRLKDGVKTKSGREHQINVVRIGRSDAINSQVIDVTMDELVSRRLGIGSNDQKKRERATELFKEHERVSARLRELYSQRDGGEVKGKELAELENEIGSTRKRKNELGIKIDNVKDEERNAGREAELNKKRAQQAVLDDAHVICATLSGSGHDMFQSLNIEFETVIIDEAAQCVEMSSLIPLKYGCVKCIMVGDPKQLPPTVFSKEAAKFQYEQSLFVRMQNNFSDEVHLLDTQYRMHPDISVFPSQTFYDGLLKDGKGMLELRKRPWHASGLLAPYRFFDVTGQHSAAPRGHSLINTAEIDIAIALYQRLTRDFNDYEYTGRIGIITPYKSQLRMLKDRFSQRFGPSILDNVEFNTTDAFQGRESEIIIFSCVRASPAGGIGFLQDIRRMNVGLTRAKSSLWVLGNSDSLVRGQYWKKLVDDAKARDCYTSGNLRAMLERPSSDFPAEQKTLRSMPDASSHVSQMQRGGPHTTVLNGTRTEGGSKHDAAPRESVDNDRMDGVRYRFEDRIAKRASHTPDAGSNRSTPQPTNGKLSEQEDVEMSNADDTYSRSATPLNVDSRAETPLSAENGHASSGNGDVRPRTATLARPVAAQIRKRPAPSPFMPRKQTKPK